MEKEAPLEIIKSVKCIHCEKLMELIPESNEFVTIHGNIMVGLSGGLIGNNFDDDGKLKKITVYCVPCFKAYLMEHLNEARFTSENR